MKLKTAMNDECRSITQRAVAKSIYLYGIKATRKNVSDTGELYGCTLNLNELEEYYQLLKSE